MQIDSTPTRARLEAITDPGKFEALAAAVLRQAEPLYRHFIETGTNADRRPIPSPVDGLMLVPDSSPPHLVCVHHTTIAQDRLRDKWLSRASEHEGDLPKTVKWAASERVKLPGAQVSLVLTTNRRVPPDLYTKVQAEGAAHGAHVDIWDQSRLADYLDNTAEGQWLRRGLGVQPTRLSARLLHELSSKSIEVHAHFENEGDRVARQLDLELSQAVETATLA
jgi:hypothetical protein